jgi:TatD DNase family protein
MPFDNHLHLGRLPHPNRLAQALAQAGYAYNAVACEPHEWEPLWELWQSEGLKSKGCNLVLGIHPMAVTQATAQHQPELRRILERDGAFQVGETGLDRRFPEYGPGELQEQWFIFQATLALEMRRDLQIHCVGDYGRAVKLLRQIGYGKGTAASRPIFHRFGGDLNVAKQILDMGGLISVHQSSLEKKSSRIAIASIPAEGLLFETDADEIFCDHSQVENCDGVETDDGSQVEDCAADAGLLVENTVRRLLQCLGDVREAAEHIQSLPR